MPILFFHLPLPYQPFHFSYPPPPHPVSTLVAVAHNKDGQLRAYLSKHNSTIQYCIQYVILKESLYYQACYQTAIVQHTSHYYKKGFSTIIDFLHLTWPIGHLANNIFCQWKNCGYTIIASNFEVSILVKLAILLTFTKIN